jgi:hypothetical protein
MWSCPLLSTQAIWGIAAAPPTGRIGVGGGWLAVGRTPNEQILSVPLLGGPVAVVADGHDPVISPSGNLLAYLSYNDITEAPEGIVVRNLLSGATRTWQGSNSLSLNTGLSWAPDSKSLSFATTTATKASEVLSASVLDLSSPNRSLDEARKIPLPPGMAWAGYLNSTQGIGVIQHVSLPNRYWFELTVVDMTTGRTVKRLQTVPGLIGGGGLGAGVQVDPSGRHLAVDVSDGSGHGNLYRWTVSTDPTRISAGPILVKDGVLSEAWVPAR